jgi:hypothetical protein
MTPRSLFTIILKIVGLLFLKNILAGIFQLLPLLANALQLESLQEMSLLVLTAVFSLLVFAIAPYCFLFKTEWLIDKLRLDQGFEQKLLALNVHRSTVLSISIIVVGGLLLVDEIPSFLQQLVTYSAERRDGQLNPDTSYLVWTVAKLAVGALLIGKQQQLVNFIEYQRKR